MTLSANSLLSYYTYNWGGPGIVGPNTTQNITVNTGGTYTLAITNTITNCVASTSIFVSQNIANPIVSVNPISQGVFCNGAPACFTAVCTPTLNVQGQWFAPGNVPIGSLSNSPLLLVIARKTRNS
jgi:hypothetical protein